MYIYRSDPFIDEATLAKFVQETEKFERMLESLTKEKLSSPSSLEIQWRVNQSKFAYNKVMFAKSSLI